MVRNKKAEELEAQGLWRRAAARWLDVMKEAHTDPQREHIARRREICLENAKRPPKKRETFCDKQDCRRYGNQTGSATLRVMEITAR